MRVLIVEDEPYLAEAIRDGLRLEAIAADLAYPGSPHSRGFTEFLQEQGYAV